MALDDEINEARKEIVSDGYDMSVGEVVNLYKDKEIKIDPEFQRLFRWDLSRKTKFIESLLLGIPIPPIFVFQNKSGIWELIDGLQRLSTVFEFIGILVGPEGDVLPPLELAGTNYLPSLSNKKWESSEGQDDGIGIEQQIEIKRARLRVEILKKESDPAAKFELFQRLNTGGARLSEQEVRNCVAVMLNKKFFDWLMVMSRNESFRICISQTDRALKRSMATELVLRFFAFKNVPYTSGLDVHEYLDKALVKMATDSKFDYEKEEFTFNKTFEIIRSVLGSDAFRRWDGDRYTGPFLMSLYEVIAISVAKNIDAILDLDSESSKKLIVEKTKNLWTNNVFISNSGSGVRGTTRLANLLPMTDDYMLQ